MRVSRGPHDIGKVVGKVGKDAARDNDLEVLFGIGKCLRASAKEGEQFVEKKHTGGNHQRREQQGEESGVPQNLLGPLSVFHAQYDRDSRGGANPHQGTDCRKKQQKRQRERQPRDGQSAYPLTDKDSVGNIVHGIGSHTNNGGKCVLP